MGFPLFDQVERAYRELLAEGLVKELPPGNQQLVEDQKGLITRRGAYYAHQIDSKYGILEKKTGNNSQGYSTDIIIDTDGNYWDVASDNGTTAFPIQGGDHFDTGLLPRWRTPTKELAGIGEEPTPIPEPEPPPDNTEELLLLILEKVTALEARQDTTDAHLNDARRMLRELQLVKAPSYQGRLALNLRLDPVT